MNRNGFLPVMTSVAFALCCATVLAARPEAKTAKTETTVIAGAVALPKFEKFAGIVGEYFQAKKKGPRALLSQGDVRALFPLLEKAGWKVADQNQILKQLLPDNDFMVQQFRTAGGRTFSEQIARLPGGFDRCDRLRRLPRGEGYLSDMIRGPDGYKLFQYMTETEGGTNLGIMLSEVDGGANFNRNTGRIYTIDDLVKRLKTSYDRVVLDNQKAAAKARFGR
jgi:hypothetical protein